MQPCEVWRGSELHSPSYQYDAVRWERTAMIVSIGVTEEIAQAVPAGGLPCGIPSRRVSGGRR